MDDGGQGGEAHLGFGLGACRPDHYVAAGCRCTGRLIEQRGLTDTGIAAEDERADVGMRLTT